MKKFIAVLLFSNVCMAASFPPNYVAGISQSNPSNTDKTLSSLVGPTSQTVVHYNLTNSGISQMATITNIKVNWSSSGGNMPLMGVGLITTTADSGVNANITWNNHGAFTSADYTQIMATTTSSGGGSFDIPTSMWGDVMTALFSTASGDDRNFNLVFYGLSNADGNLAAANLVITFTNPTNPHFTVNIAPGIRAEESGQGLASITMTNKALFPMSFVISPVHFAENTIHHTPATTSADFSTQSWGVTIPANQQVATGIVIPISENDDDEAGAESFKIMAQPIQDYGLNSSSTSTQVCYIAGAGDADLDFDFDSDDLVTMFIAGKYETGNPATWVEGDFNHDGIFNPDDLIVLFALGNYVDGAVALTQAVGYYFP